MTLRDDQTRFFGKLAAMMEAEVPLLNAFEVASDSVVHPGFKVALDRILSAAYSGTSLTEAILAEGSIFSPEVMCLLRHGEDTGDLEMKSGAIASGLKDGTFETGVVTGTAEDDLLSAILAAAAAEGVTDIHVEPVEGGAEVRFRREGDLAVHRSLSHAEAGVLAVLTKRQANLDASVSARPQSGSLTHEGVRMRVSLCPYADGEGIAFRSAWPTGEAGVDGLTLGEDRAAEVKSWLAAGRGIVLVGSPPAGGRVQTIEASLAELDRKRRKVISVERGERVRLPGLLPIRVDPESGWTAAEALRTTLLQDLDVVGMIDPVDAEVAALSIGAALSGHLVILSVAARGPVDALSAFAGLLPDPEALSEALLGVIAVRRFPRIDGAGTIPIHEVVSATADIRAALRRGAEMAGLSGALPKARRTLRAEAERLVGEGVVAAEQVERAFG